MTWSVDDYLEACNFAAKAHCGQLIPGTGLPYVVHPVRVCAEVIAVLRNTPGLDETLAIQGALLHDVLEDTETDYATLVTTFGPEVADGVRALSKDKSLDKELQMADSLRRIRQQPQEIAMVKLADRISNLVGSPPPHWDMERRITYADESALILKQLGRANRMLKKRLARRILDFEYYIVRF